MVKGESPAHELPVNEAHDHWKSENLGEAPCRHWGRVERVASAIQSNQYSTNAQQAVMTTSQRTQSESEREPLA